MDYAAAMKNKMFPNGDDAYCRCRRCSHRGKSTERLTERKNYKITRSNIAMEIKHSFTINAIERTGKMEAPLQLKWDGKVSKMDNKGNAECSCRSDFKVLNVMAMEWNTAIRFCSVQWTFGCGAGFNRPPYCKQSIWCFIYHQRQWSEIICKWQLMATTPECKTAASKISGRYTWKWFYRQRCFENRLPSVKIQGGISACIRQTGITVWSC